MGTGPSWQAFPMHDVATLHQLLSLSFHVQQVKELWSYAFMRPAVVACALLAVLCGYLSVHVVLRRVVFVSVALAECSSVGAALALVRGLEKATALPYTLGFGLGGVVLMALVSGTRRISREAVVGIVYAGGAAVSILVLAIVRQHEGHELSAMLWGEILAIKWGDLSVMAAAFGVIGLVHLLLRKELLLSGYDPEMARALGYRVWLLDLLFYASLGVAIALSIRIVGLLVVFAFFTVPGAVGLLAARGLRGAALMAIAAGIVASALGIHLSWVLDLPTGLVVVALLVALVPVAALVGRVRTAIAGARGGGRAGRAAPAASSPSPAEVVAGVTTD